MLLVVIDQTCSSMEFHLENPLTNAQDLFNDDGASANAQDLFNDDGDVGSAETRLLDAVFVLEAEHMPSACYTETLKARGLDASLREEAVSSILQSSCKFDPFSSYLAITYMDRFSSSQEMPKPAKPWMVRLLAVSCFSLAAKMRQIDLSSINYLDDGGLIFETQTIQRMEYIILGALNWRMRSITPFSFLPFFITLFKLSDPVLIQALKTRATEIIFKSQIDIKLLEFKPSVIAASALLLASRELFPLQFPCFRKAISNCPFVNKENMLQSYKVMQSTSPMNDDEEEEEEEEGESEIDHSEYSSSNSPVNVLDRRFSSSESDDKTNVTATITETKGYCC